MANFKLTCLAAFLAATMGLERIGVSRTKILLMWCAITAICVAAAVIGFALLSGASPALVSVVQSFAAGAMVYVVVEELIPEAHLGEHSNVGTFGVIAGFVIMMVLDVALG